MEYDYEYTFEMPVKSPVRFPVIDYPNRIERNSRCPYCHRTKVVNENSLMIVIVYCICYIGGIPILK